MVDIDALLLTSKIKFVLRHVACLRVDKAGANTFKLAFAFSVQISNIA